jgi:hypothetical protein
MAAAGRGRCTPSAAACCLQYVRPVRSVSLGRYIIVLIAAAFTLVVSGCGSSGGSSSSAPSDVVNQFFDGAGAGDSQVCSLLTKEAQDKVGVGTSTCESGVEQFGARAKPQLKGLDVGEAEIDGDRATVPVKTAAASTTVTLQRDGDSWLISSLGSG